MADFVSPKMRSKIMRGVKHKNTKPEIHVRRMLHSMGYRFRLHRKDLPGKPDIVLSKHGLVILVNGCFWHQHSKCKDGRIPTSNIEYWAAKLTRNIERDQENKLALESLGWKVHTVWECEANEPLKLLTSLRKVLPPKEVQS